MLLIAEVLLTVKAWRNGYGPLALLPLLVPLAVCSFFAFHPSAPSRLELPFAMLIGPDLLAIAALIVLTLRPRRAVAVSR